MTAVVQYLQVLEESDLERTEKVRRVRTCRIDPEGLDVARRWLDERKTVWEERVDLPGDLLREPESG